MNRQYYTLENESKTKLFAQIMAQSYYKNMTEQRNLIVYLQGDLGAGKSFFSRAFIQFFLPLQKVKSPTYTIVESYSTEAMIIHHFDLYRLSDPEELEYLAIRDLLTEPFVALVEWPQKGEGIFPGSDIVIEFLYDEQKESAIKHSKTTSVIHFDARSIAISATSKGGEKILEYIMKHVEN
ncbi:tRNA threonylcarbamoyladenosine biosynthesis protein TsaE [hydrothermal vent metagenome]|uniref:tRNA threonylcarbamoyladenosine biosynthesis protein TsaE n=1 Tax=hydrothermal vent metagenome TaxID=652676 RepID=A0A3B0W7K5_9ZZZZ